MRKLAEQSAQAAGHITQLISQIQTETANAITSMQDGTKAVQEGISLVEVAGDSFKVVNAINEVSVQAQEVSAVVEQVNTGTHMMVASIENIEKVSIESQGSTETVAAAVEEQTASMQEIEAAANTLARMAEELQESVAAFKI